MRQNVRPIKVVKNYIPHAEGSCLFSMGKTKVLCVATVEDRRPPHAEEKNIGWVSAEYAMLPRAGDRRTSRNRASSGGRSQEISRLIGRSFRSVVDLEKVGPRSILIDCDVIQADGGTRTASINGGIIALTMALKKLYRESLITDWPLKQMVSAVSVGIVNGQPVLDLDYSLDSGADVDFNFVMTADGRFVEMQGTAERVPFGEKQFQQLLSLAKRGIRQILQHQKKAIGKIP
ncbi:MAG: ribonuclease PH [Elusimicrobia bacterium]|nr:ribonuclease PH [Elusimicrobiota bacterium]